MSPAKKRGRITVSALGGTPPSFSVGRSFDGLVSQMTAHWKRSVATVLPARPDLIVLPEMCDRFCGTPSEALHEIRTPMHESMSRMLSEVARDHACYIVYPTAATDDAGHWRNAAIVLDRSGNVIGRYFKNFLVVTEIDNHLVPGAGPCIVECDFGRMGLAICFDLNFCELIESYRLLRPDLMVFPSNYHGAVMQPYWAYQTRSHFVGCMGRNDVPSEMYSPIGHCIAAGTNYFPHMTTQVNLDCTVVHLDFNWEKLKALGERYGRSVTIFDPGRLGAVLITSEHPEVPVSQMVEEFEIETLDAYLDRSRRRNLSARL